MGFWSDFTGASARNDIKKGRRLANEALDTGATDAYEHIDTGIGRLDSYADPAGYDAYKASLGLSGDEARDEVQRNYLTDPIQKAIADRVTRANTRRFTGVGLGNSGPATQSLTNALLDRWGAYQDKLKGAGELGLQGAGAQATLDKGKGDIAFTTGQQKAGIETSSANSMAASRGILTNNLLGVGSLIVSGMTGMPAVKKPGVSSGSGGVNALTSYS